MSVPVSSIKKFYLWHFENRNKIVESMFQPNVSSSCSQPHSLLVSPSRELSEKDQIERLKKEKLLNNVIEAGNSAMLSVINNYLDF